MNYFSIILSLDLSKMDTLCLYRTVTTNAKLKKKYFTDTGEIKLTGDQFHLLRYKRKQYLDSFKLNEKEPWGTK